MKVCTVKISEIGCDLILQPSYYINKRSDKYDNKRVKETCRSGNKKR